MKRLPWLHIVIMAIGLMACSPDLSERAQATPIVEATPMSVSSPVVSERIPKLVEILATPNSDETLWVSVETLGGFLYEEYCRRFEGCVAGKPEVVFVTTAEELATELGIPVEVLLQGFPDTYAYADLEKNRIIINKNARGVIQGLEEIRKGEYSYYNIMLGYTVTLIEEIYHLDSVPRELLEPFNLFEYSLISTRGFGYSADNGVMLANIEEGSAVFISRYFAVSFLKLSGEPESGHQKDLDWFKTHSNTLSSDEIVALHRVSDPDSLLMKFYGGDSVLDARAKFVSEFQK